jgi:UDP-N-acetylglucosamine--N-acetylmuramyl-(pentapeptide) pyrophosphoryl-undecaprenol N-acetylglucosamine transferase
LQKSEKPYRIIISGGGTGGHIFPAIAIARALQAIDAGIEILFVGAEGRMEMQKVPEAGYPIIGLPIRGLQRRLTLENLTFPYKVLSSIIKSFRILSDFKPDAVVGVGGYASGPLLYAASVRKIPALLQEQNSYAGLTNKWLATNVQKICVAQEGMGKFFPEEKLVVTGNPVRKEIVAAAQTFSEEKRLEALKFFGLTPEKKTLLAIGGSLGARTINLAILEGIPQLVEAGIQVIWQCGKFYHEEMRTKLDALPQKEGIVLFEFLHQMDLAYAASDIVISRAGALSISELCLVKKPTLFVPSPNVAEDHQRKNAEALVSRNAAVMVLDKDAPEKMVKMALALLEDEEKQKDLQTNISQLAKPNATETIANEVIALCATKTNKP